MNGTDIRKCREALGLSMDEFAAKLGFTGDQRRGNISRYEADKMKPHRSVKARIQSMIDDLKKK